MRAIVRDVKVLALLVLAGSLAVPAAAGAPDGFRDSARLQPITSAIAGRPVVVRCARTNDAWTALLNEYRVPNARGLVLHDAAYLSTNVCRSLEGWLRGKAAPTVGTLGVDALTLTHEAMHLRGLVNEHDTDCAALKELPRVLRVQFRVRSTRNLAFAIRYAWAEHNSSSPIYAGPC